MQSVIYLETLFLLPCYVYKMKLPQEQYLKITNVLKITASVNRVKRAKMMISSCSKQ